MNRTASHALCIGHPGHEIKVLSWASQHKPVVTILTDGSGPNRQSRLESTRKVLESMGCETGKMFGALADREIYALMREGPEPFVGIASQLAAEWTQQGVTTVSGDALEGYNPTHDVCRMIINAVVEKSQRQNRKFHNYSFPLDSLLAPTHEGAALVLQLDDDQYGWKKNFVDQLYPEMAGEVGRVLSLHGEAPFRTEVLYREPEGKAGLFWTRAEPPYYESYGARQIEKGHYDQLITYREHLQPIAEGLWQWASVADQADVCAS